MWIGGLTVQQSGATYSAIIPDTSARHQPEGLCRREFRCSDSVVRNRKYSVEPLELCEERGHDHHSVFRPDFMAAAETWANYRRGQGFNVQVVDVADILDEYSYGSLRSVAIHDFLQYAHANWTPQVADKQYVLLMGDGSTDPRNYTGWGYFDQVPTMMVTTVYQETGSDEALADFNGDGLAEMAVGHIPFRTSAAITTAFNKTVNFEANSALQSFDRGALFVYDQPNGYDFAGMSQDLASFLPQAAPKQFVGLAAPPPPAPPACGPPTICDQGHAELVSAINTGKLLVNYSGHGRRASGQLLFSCQTRRSAQS